MYKIDHLAYKKLRNIGEETTGQVHPRAIVVFSAHWQAGSNMIEVNTAEKADLIYEYVENARVQSIQIKLTPLDAEVSTDFREILQKTVPQCRKQGGGRRSNELVEECGHRGEGCSAWTRPRRLGELQTLCLHTSVLQIAQGSISVVILAFDSTRNPLKVPIVQVSLFDTEDHVIHGQLRRSFESCCGEQWL